MKGSKDGDSGENGEATGNGSGERKKMKTWTQEVTTQQAPQLMEPRVDLLRERRRPLERVQGQQQLQLWTVMNQTANLLPVRGGIKKTVCKYRAKCYQAGARHREQFDHPWDVGGVHKLECANIKVEDVSELGDLYTLWLCCRV